MSGPIIQADHHSHRRFYGLRGCLAIALFAVLACAQAAPTVHIFAAASLTDALDAAIQRYETEHEVDIIPVYAASSTAARQVAQGAPADLYLSANERWMDWLARQRVSLASRADVLRNRLALITPRGSGIRSFTPGAGKPLESLLGNGQRIAVGNPEHVPAGIYARQALASLGEWTSLAPRLARADNVRAALALVERGETPLGIVYRTDTLASDAVRQLGLFPETSHDPITYPVALVNPPASDAAAAFRKWLTGGEAMDVFRDFGFASASSSHP